MGNEEDILVAHGDCAGVKAALGQAGCGQHSGKAMVIMQHPETMAFVDCKVGKNQL